MAELLGLAIGLSAGAAEKRFDALPEDLQHGVIQALRDGDAMEIRKAFNLACCLHDKAKVEAQKVSDSRFDHLE